MEEDSKYMSYPGTVPTDDGYYVKLMAALEQTQSLAAFQVDRFIFIGYMVEAAKSWIAYLYVDPQLTFLEYCLRSYVYVEIDHKTNI